MVLVSSIKVAVVKKGWAWQTLQVAGTLWLGSAILNCEGALGVESDHERVMEQQIETLEKRVAELEVIVRAQQRLLEAKTKLPQGAPQRSAASNLSGHDHRTTAAQPSDTVLGTDHQKASQPTRITEAIAANSASDVASAPNKTQTDPATPGDSGKNAPQELNVLRENSVTLDPRQIEISSELNYATRRTTLQHDQALLSNTSIRFGVLRNLELSLTVPLGYTTRDTLTGPQTETGKTVSGFGDILLQANLRLLEQSAHWPGAVLSLGTFLPTGANPYNFQHYALNVPGVAATPNPINILGDYFSSGDWGFRTNLQVYKTVDPLILFFGFGANYFLPMTFGPYTVQTGYRLHYNAGFSFALSEKTTLGFTVDGQYLPNLKVNGRSVFESWTAPAIARLSLIQRVADRTYFEPSLSFGINQDAPDFIIGAGLRHEF